MTARDDIEAVAGDHALVWEFDRDTTTCHAVCNAAEDADCRLYCPDDCETFSEIHRHTDVTFDGETVHRITHDDCEAVMRPDECNVCLFLNESGCVEELALGGYPSGPRFTIATVPIRPSWEGDGYEWEPLPTETTVERLTRALGCHPGTRENDGTPCASGLHSPALWGADGCTWVAEVAECLGELS